jgi:hypothetical protein
MLFRLLYRLVDYSVVVELFFPFHKITLLKLNRQLNIAYCSPQFNLSPFNGL